MKHSAVAVALVCATITNPIAAAATSDAATASTAAVSLTVGCGGGITSRAGRGIEVSGTGAVTLICPKSFSSSISPARSWRLSGTPVDAALVAQLGADLDAVGFDAIPQNRFPGPVPDGISCTLTRMRGTASHGVSIATSPRRDVSHLSTQDMQAYEAVRATVTTLQRVASLASGAPEANQCPTSSADPGEVQRRSHVTAICRHRSRSIFIQAQIDEDGTTTLWDWSFRADQPPSSAWSRPPIPVTFPANRMTGAAHLIAALDKSGFAAGDAAGTPDLICGLERAFVQAGRWSTVRLEWPGLEPPPSSSAEVRDTFEAVRRHADTLPDAGTFRLMEDGILPERSLEGER